MTASFLESQPSERASRLEKRVKEEPVSDRGYTNPHLLWSPEELNARLGDPKLSVLDVRLTADYVRGHVPGAGHLDLYGISLCDTRPEPLQAFCWMVAYMMGNRGVDSEKAVVFYQENSGWRAARGFWFLEYFGHEDVHILDGGFDAWRGAGFPVSQEPVDVSRTSFETRTIPSKVATAKDILDRLDNENVKILDTRSDDEYTGKLVRAARGGAIPHAVHLEWTNNLDSSGRYKPASELRAMYEEQGITPDKEIIPYCQGGYRSAHTYLALRLLGYPRLRNYVGSWKEWGDRVNLPIETHTSHI